MMTSKNCTDGLCLKLKSRLSDLTCLFTASNPSFLTTLEKKVKFQLWNNVDCATIPMLKNTNIVGVTFDSLLYFSANTTWMGNKIQTKIDIHLLTVFKQQQHWSRNSEKLKFLLLWILALSIFRFKLALSCLELL